VPSQKLGSESPRRPKLRAPRSSGVFGRSAETRPSGRPTRSATTAAAPASSAVAGSRDAISVTTGWPVRME